jgi:hypothetical protein
MFLVARISMDSRESIFECVWGANGQESRVVVRAWDAEEAEATARALMQRAGIGSARIRVGTPAISRKSARRLS